jgi:hypothetical protein
MRGLKRITHPQHGQHKQESASSIPSTECCCIGGEKGAKYTITGRNYENLGHVVVTGQGDGVLYLPKNMDSKDKGVNLAAAHMLDYMFYDYVIEAGPINEKCCDCYCCGCIMPCRLHSLTIS